MLSSGEQDNVESAGSQLSGEGGTDPLGGAGDQSPGAVLVGKCHDHFPEDTTPMSRLLGWPRRPGYTVV